MNPITSKIIQSICFCILLITASTLNLLAKSKVTAVNGNQFYWTSEIIDSTYVIDPSSGQEMIYISENKSYIYKVNTDSTYFINQLDVPIGVNDKINFENYFQNALFKVFHTFPNEINSIAVNNIIVDTTGKIIYQDFILNPNDNNFNITTFKQNYSATYNEMLFTLRKIMKEAPSFKPGKKQSKNVNVILDPIEMIAIKRW